MNSSRKQIEVLREDQSPRKWSVALREDVLKRFMMTQQQQGNSSSNNSNSVQVVINKVFGDHGSLFSPLLFGKFFDPSDAFPLWEFESDVLLCNLKSSGLSTVDWFRTDQDYVLKAELPEIGKHGVQVYAENQKAVEICGQWAQQRETMKSKDWRSGNWWEFGFVRRLELPDDADWKRVEAYLTNDTLLEIKIPKKNLGFDDPSYTPKPNENNVSSKNSDQV